MPRPRRPIPALLAATILFLTMAYPSFYLQLFCTREFLRLAAALGLSDSSRGLGGQILGFNYARHPRWVFHTAGFLAAAVAFIPALTASILTLRRLSGASRVPLCGRCGHTLQNLSEPRCPYCHTDLTGDPAPAAEPALHRLLRAGGTRAVLARRLAVAVLAFATGSSLADSFLRYRIQGWIIDAGRSAGCHITQAGVVMIGPRGPFLGEGLASALWNSVWRNGPWLSTALIGYAAALATYSLCAGSLGATRVFGYRGMARCGRCRYPLQGLREPRCPECGQVI